MLACRPVLVSLSLAVLALAGCPSPEDGETDAPSTDVAETDGPTETDGGTTDTGTPGTDGTTDTGEEACDPVTGFTARLGAQILEARFTVDVGGPEDVFVACTSAEEPLEKHLVESSGPATSHELVLRGLLANTTYTCVARSMCGTEAPTLSAEVTTGRPADVPILTATHTPGEAMSGAYTMFNQQGGCGPNSMMYLGIVDPDARLRWLYEVGDHLVLDVDFQLMDPNTVHLGGGWGVFDEDQGNLGVFRDVDLSGNTLLERTEPDYGLGFNHHSEALADGTYLTITGDIDTNGVREWNGAAVELWHPTNGVVWSWNSNALALAGEVDPPTIIDELLLPSPYHPNASTLITDTLGDALWLSIYGYQELWRIDRATGERTHVFGQGGDFTLVDPAGDPLPDSEYTWVQHGIDYKPDGHVLAYDNGVGRPGGSYSRVVEYQLDLSTNRATRLWDWTEPGWYDTVVGDADYLPNGNVLVTQGFSRCVEIIANDVSEIVELRPPDTVVSRITWPSSSWGVYRSERYDGCAVFANARYCDAVATRWTELGLD